MKEKETLHALCLSKIQEKLEKLSTAQQNVQAAMESETKSSAGDKFETSRAMLQQEEDQLSRQKFQWTQCLLKLKSMDITSSGKSVKEGSLIMTDKAKFYLSVALGKIIHNSTTFYVISKESPIGSNMMGKQIGDQIGFNGTDYLIKEVL